ncbi:enoyl-CoA hydratase/isomerase family protein [uncultured Mycobacterium sp.]|uniref:enoyl-CoA hydratase/isomerase family protein n=1 Tax=uncultured Mycobacterium sp. TaxID=171292 RepID=UPI0035CBB658
MNTNCDDDVLFSVKDHIARITLNRPQRANALTPAMMPVLRGIWRRIAEDPDIRCVVLTAAGQRHFCTGADLTGVAETGSVGVGSGEVSQELFLTARQNNVWKPTVCAVNGVVAGGGLHFVADADIVIASTSACFIDTHVSIGMVAGVENIGLAKRLPLGTVLRMTLQGRNFRLSAQRAYMLGLVEEVVSPGELMSTAEAIARDITRNSPHAVSLSQQALWSSLEMAYSEAVEHGFGLVKAHRQHADFIEGPRAFSEGRQPNWTTALANE